MLPPPQHPYEQALQLGFAALLARPPQDLPLQALGAVREADIVRLPVLNRHISVHLTRREVFVELGGRARSVWSVLVVHYLCANPATPPDACEVSFSQFADCRSYLSVFGKRIVARFLATAGRTAEQFVRLSEQLGGVRLAGPGDRYRFHVLPRVPLVIARHEGDLEVGPGASVLYCADVERLLPAEDRVVAAELLLDVLSGKPMTENGGPRETRH